jgi:hypothetical protein
MKAITSTWFECQVSVPKTQDDGSVKVANEVYTVDALTFTEAEARITDEMQPYVANMVGGFNIKNINPAQYKEIFFSEDKKDDRWFKVKVAFITYDEKTSKEKLSNVFYLVQADKSETATTYTNEVLGKGMADYRIVSNVETRIMDVFQH